MNTATINKYSWKFKIYRRKATVQKYSSRIIMKILMYCLLIGLAFVFIYPFIFMFTNSLKRASDLMDMSTKWIIRDPNWINYKDAMKDMHFWRGFKNSTLVALLSAAGQIISCSFIAYGIARFKFPGKRFIFTMVIFSLVIPPQVLVIPLYIQYSSFNMLDTFLPIIIPCFVGMGLKGGLFIFLFIQYYKGLPQELEEAARIDGCGVLNTFFRIVLPISRSSILVTAILSIVWHWNDYFEPSCYLLAPDKSLITLSINLITAKSENFFMMADGTIINPKAMAAGLLAIIPLLIMYLILQKQFMAGIERTGLAN